MTDRIDPIAAARALIEPLTGYTPGPWRQGKNNPGRVSKQTHQSYPRNESNARLIAAAPALRDMVATLADALEAERAENQRLREALEAENQRLRATLSAITATDCYSRDECTAMARAALSGEGE